MECQAIGDAVRSAASRVAKRDCDCRSAINSSFGSNLWGALLRLLEQVSAPSVLYKLTGENSIIEF